MKRVIYCILVIISSQLANSQQLIKGEYFFDEDPGFGNGLPVSFSAGTDLSGKSFIADMTGLTPGIHNLYFRTEDEAGHWSQTTSLISIRKLETNTPAASNVVGGEYFINNDPGIGSGNPVVVTPGADLANQTIPDAGVFDNGVQKVYFRSRDNLGRWSQTQTVSLYKTNSSSLPTPLNAVEYFIDTDPGLGAAFPVAINPSSNIADYPVPVNLTGQTAANHRLYWRTRNETGNWSQTNSLSYSINTAIPSPEIVVSSVTSKSSCAWGNFQLSYHPTGTYNPGNVFTAQLSDAAGSFSSPSVIGNLATTGAGIMNVVLPKHLPEGTGYKVRVISSDIPVSGLAGEDNLTLHDRPELGADTTAFIVCANETINLLPLYNTSGLTSSWSTNNPTVAPAGNYTLFVSNTYGCKDTAVATVKQDIAIWTGAVNTDWHNGANWSSGRVPTDKTHVIFAAQTINGCQVKNANAVAASVQGKTASSISIIAGRTLDIKARCNPLPSGQ